MDYKFKLEMHQQAHGSENAKVKVSVNDVVVVEEQEIASSDAGSPTAFLVTATGIDAPASDTSANVKIELLNDEYVDGDNDRNAVMVGIKYAYKQTGFDAWSVPVRWEATDGASIGENTNKNVSWEPTSSDATYPWLDTYESKTIVTTGTGDSVSDDWESDHAIIINTDFVTFALPLTESYPTTKTASAFYVDSTTVGDYTLLD